MQVKAGAGALVGAAMAVGALALAAPAHGASCLGTPTATGVPERPGAPLRFGISPNVQTGQFGTGPATPRIPEDPAQQVAALRALTPPGVPLVLRLTRFFWSDGEAGVERYLALANRYTSAGFLVELQLRYHPDASEQGNIPAWVAFVRSVVDRFGPNRRVVGIQVTNEVNFAVSPDSSDGSYTGGKDALIAGVIAAKDEARRRGFGQLKIGFNWVYRSDPNSESSFWSYLHDNGGPTFVQSLDWIGLDAYPGTLFPPSEPPGGGRDGMVSALSTLRCYAESAGIPDAKPIYVEENGYPTGSTPDRSYARQQQELEAMVQAVNDFRGTYNVSDYRWFDLRDSDSTSPNFQQQYGLMTDAYVPKPAFAAYRRLIDELSLRSPAGGPAVTPVGPGARGRLRLSLSCVGGRLVVSVAGARAPRVRSLRVLQGRRVLGRGRRVVVFGRLGPAPLRVVVTLRGGGRRVLRASAPNCRRTAANPSFTG